MSGLRRKKTSEKYRAYIQEGNLKAICPLCVKESHKNFKHWRIVENKFPYDLIAQTHHMLIPNRHVEEDKLTEEEKQEAFNIKQHYINDHYDLLFEATNKTKSIPEHFHYHLIELYPDEVISSLHPE